MFSGCVPLVPALHYGLQRALSFLVCFPEAYSLFWTRTFPVSGALGFLLDPSADPYLLALPAPAARELLRPLFQSVRMVIWPVHRARLRGLGLGHFL